MKYEKRDILIHDTSIVADGVILGSHMIIRPFCVIGDEPLVFDPDVRRFRRIPPQHSVELGNHVWVGSHSSIMKGMTRNTTVGDRVILGQFCNVGHDCKIESDVRIMNGVMLEGYVTVGRGSFIGAGATVRERTSIGEGSVVGMGSNVVADVPRNVVAYGNPCRVVKDHYPKLKAALRGLLLRI